MPLRPPPPERSGASRAVLHWVVIPGASLAFLVLCAVLASWLTRSDATPPVPAPTPTVKEAPPVPPARPPTPSPPDVPSPPVVPPPAFPSPQSAVPVLPAPGPADARRVVEAQPVIESTTGRITPEDIHRAIQAVSPLVEQCFEDVAQRNRGPQTVKLRFTVEGKGTEGAMSRGELVTSTVPDPFAQACILDSLLDARFPAPEGGGQATVVYPFEFRVAGETGR